MTAEEDPVTHPVYEAAERYVRLGISVIPIDPRTKEPPAGFRWGEYAERIASADERYDWFVERGYQLAVIGGPISGNLTPLDFDSAGGFDALAERYPALWHLPRVRTGSGKTHVWLRTERPCRKYVCRAPDGGNLEVRAGKHYTVAPPSLHPSGRPYRWEVEPWQGIPVLALESIGLQHVEPRAHEPGEPIDEGEPLSERDMAHIVELLSAHYSAGARHDLCLAVAGWLAGHGVPEADSTAIVSALVEGAGDDAAQLREVLRGVRGTYRRTRQGIAVLGWSRLIDPRDPLISPATAKSLDLLLRSRDPLFSFETRTDDRPRYPWIISVADLLAEPDEPDVFLVDGILRASTLNLIVGPPKTYKSFFVQGLSVALASGLPLFDTFAVAEPASVIYIQEESARRYLRRRFRAILHGAGLHHGAIRESLFAVTNERFRLDDPAHFERLLHEGIEVYRPRAIIFDPLREMHWQDENKAEAMMPILQALKNVRDDCNVSIGLVHHNNKNPTYTNPADSIRGSTAIWGAMDGGIFVSTTDNEHEVKVNVVLKEGGQAAPFLYRLHEAGGAITFTVVELGKTGKPGISDELVLDYLRSAGWATPAEIAGALGLSERTVRPHLKDMAERKRIRLRETALEGRGRRRLMYGPPGIADDAPDF